MTRPTEPRRGPAVRRDRGGSTVEMALVLPFLLSLIFGAVHFGRLFAADQDVATASREGARYALSGSRYDDCAGIKSAAARLALRTGVTANDVTIQYDTGPGTQPTTSCPVASANLVAGQRIVVTVRHTVNPIVPFFGAVTASATTRRTIPRPVGG